MIGLLYGCLSPNFNAKRKISHLIGWQRAVILNLQLNNRTFGAG